jgi:hypothetical protein
MLKYRIKFYKKAAKLNPLTYGGGLIGPPLFQRPRSLEMLLCQKFEKITIPLLGSLLCESILLLLQ